MAIAKLFKTVRLYDPAIKLPEATSADDLKAVGDYLRKFAQHRKLDDLEFVDGAKPVFYYLRPIPRKAITWVLAPSSEDERLLRAFAIAVDRVENFVDVDGNFVESYAPTRPERKAGEVDAISGDELDRFQFVDIREIGKVAFDRATVPFDCGGGYAPPPSSESAWHMRLTVSLSRLVAALSSSSRSESSDDQPPASETSPTTIDDASALLGGATAPSPVIETRSTGPTE